MTMFATIFVSLLILYWISRPLLNSGQPALLSAEQEMTRERIESLENALASLHEAKRRERIRAEDFENMERRLVLQLARIHNRYGTKPGAIDEAEPQKDGSCGRCGTAGDPDYAYCPKCGIALAA
jgi:hypothetical protein